MIHIAISQAAFEAIARTLPLGSVSFETRSTSRASACSGWSRTWSTGSGLCPRGRQAWHHSRARRIRVKRPSRHPSTTT